MTLQPLFPVEVELKATDDRMVTDRVRRAIYRGDTYLDSGTVLDTGRNVFNLGPIDAPWYEIRVQARAGPASEGFPSICSATATITNGPAGQYEYEFTPENTRKLTMDRVFIDVEIQNSSDDRFSENAVFTVRRASGAPLGDATRSTDLEGDGSVSSEESSSAALDSASSLSSSGLFGEVSILDGVADGEVRLRSIFGRQGVQTSIVENSIVVERKPRLYQPLSRSPRLLYFAEPFCSRRTAGEVDDTGLADNHQDDEAGGAADAFYTAAEYANNTPTKWGFPYMVGGVAVDTYGLPHNDHRRIRGSSSLSTHSGLHGRRIVGYEFGHAIRRGDFTRGRKIVWDITGAMENVGYSDAFVEFCLDINPDCTGGTYATTNRMRMTSGNREFWTWAGEALFRARIELVALGAEGHAFFGEFHLYDPATGGHMDSWEVGNKVSSFDWIAGQELTAYQSVGSQSTGTAALAVDTGTRTIEKGATVAVLISGVYYTATVTADYVGGTGDIALSGWSRSGVTIADNTPIYVRRDMNVVQCRWRVDRDIVNRLDTFDDTYQGPNQGANTLRLHVDRYHPQFIGFGER